MVWVVISCSDTALNVLGPPGFGSLSITFIIFYYFLSFLILFYSILFFISFSFLFSFFFFLFPFSKKIFFEIKKTRVNVAHVPRHLTANELEISFNFSFKFKLSAVPSIHPIIWKIFKFLPKPQQARHFQGPGKISIRHKDFYLDCLMLFPLHYRLLFNIIYSKLEHRSIVISGSLNI